MKNKILTPMLVMLMMFGVVSSWAQGAGDNPPPNCPGHSEATVKECCDEPLPPLPEVKNEKNCCGTGNEDPPPKENKTESCCDGGNEDAPPAPPKKKVKLVFVKVGAFWFVKAEVCCDKPPPKKK